ncbi:hypothetical protein HMPREF0043_00133 [Actinobaculum sp. oral taxon 183 str. F0552]|nr:hypothetical protein HMPREF0043_00133 [Actinobaculum sp. oral taxon 183 str. F0552]
MATAPAASLPCDRAATGDDAPSRLLSEAKPRAGACDCAGEKPRQLTAAATMQDRQSRDEWVRIDSP